MGHRHDLVAESESEESFGGARQKRDDPHRLSRPQPGRRELFMVISDERQACSDVVWRQGQCAGATPIEGCRHRRGTPDQFLRRRHRARALPRNPRRNGASSGGLAGIELQAIGTSWSEMEGRLATELAKLRSDGFAGVVLGDIHLTDVRAWYEERV